MIKKVVILVLIRVNIILNEFLTIIFYIIKQYFCQGFTNYVKKCFKFLIRKISFCKE